MFRELRRKKKAISIEDAKALLHKERRGVLAVNGDDGYPYAIPINYLYDEEANQIIFHGAKAGHKVDALRASDKVCFTVYGNEETGEPEWAPYLQSVVIFGRCHMIDDPKTTIEMVKTFATKYYPNEKTIDEEIAASGKAVLLYVIDIEHISGKQIQEI